MNRIRYTTLQIKAPRYWMLLAVLGVIMLAGLSAAYYMEHEGHWVTGMSNQIVWGVPHVFAILLIVAASGALNVASMASVFGVDHYKPLARMSGLLAIGLLIGGLSILVLDLGRPDRLIVAMTTFNFKSIFAWNIFLYTGFLFVAAIYLWMQFEPRMGAYTRRVGVFAFIWRFVLTTGTGSIFGFLVARSAYDAAVMAPLFVAMSLALGTAVFLLVALSMYSMSNQAVNDEWVSRLRRLNGVFVAAVFYFTVVQHLANLYVAEHSGIEKFLLVEGGSISAMFWLGQIIIGTAMPMLIFFHPRLSALRWTVIGAGCVVIGSVAQLYVIIVGGQAFPLDLFPGMRVTSQFFDGAIARYSPSLPELVLAIGGVALALFVVLSAMRVLPFLPDPAQPASVPKGG